MTDDLIGWADMPAAIREAIRSPRTLARRSRNGDFPPMTRLFRRPRWSRTAVESWLADRLAEAGGEQ